VLAALRRDEEGLRLSGKAASVPGAVREHLDAAVAARDKAPQFVAQSNWHRIGCCWPRNWMRPGQKEKAAGVRDKLGVKAKE